MRIRLLSDLHLEGGAHTELFKSQGEDILVIAGDLNTGAANTWTSLKRFADYQPNIVYVFGNHEFYRQEYFVTITKLQEWAKYTSIKVLNPDTVHFHTIARQFVSSPSKDTVAFIGAPLWTNFRNNDLSKLSAKLLINDFRLIEYDNHFFSPRDSVDLFNRHSAYIKQQYEVISTKKVIVTHFMPAIDCIDPSYLEDKTGLNHYFANDLGSWIHGLEDTTWLFGHTHSVTDVIIGTTRAIANPYGYGTNERYKECLIDL